MVLFWWAPGTAMIGIRASFFFPPGVSVATCMAILHVGSAQQVRTGSTSSKEDDYESDAATIVQKCVSHALGTQAPPLLSEEIGPAPSLPGWRKGRGVLPLGQQVLSGRRSPCLFGSWVGSVENTASSWWQWTL